MLKQIAAMVLAAFAASSQAEQVEQKWDFTWSGKFYSSDLNEIREYSFNGSFSAIDANGDQQIVTSELTGFFFDYQSILPCKYTECSVSDFSYTGGNALTFNASTYEYFEGSNNPWDFWIAYGSNWNIALGEINEQTYCTQCQIYSYLIAQDVTMTVTEVTAVPEPATYAMLGLGLATVGAVARRRRRKD